VKNRLKAEFHSVLQSPVLQEPTPEIPAFRFGVFEADFVTSELRKRGIRIKLQEQPFRILALLLEHSGQVVSRETIRRTLWPDDTFVEFEQSISAAVAKLRIALGDSAENPRFIETVAKHGYRFIAPVARTVEASPMPPPPLERIRKAQPAWRRRWQIAGAFVTLAITIGVAILIWKTGAGRQISEAEFRATPLTSYPGLELGPSFSPDGSRVAFGWNGPSQDNCDIYLKLIGPGDPLRLTTDPRCDYAPAWSPDDTWIAFLRSVNDNEQAILLIPALGGHEREVARTRIAKETFLDVNWPLLSWSPDGKWLFTLEAMSQNAGAYAVARVPVESGEEQQVTFPPAKGPGDSAVAVSPDGRTLAFTRTVSDTVIDLYIVPLSEQSLPVRAPEPIVAGGWVEGIAWTPDSRELVFSGNVGGREGCGESGCSGRKRLAGSLELDRTQLRRCVC
jgi:DNA-binding winged helix-turn-helix (wHTH) protein